MGWRPGAIVRWAIPNNRKLFKIQFGVKLSTLKSSSGFSNVSSSFSAKIPSVEVISFEIICDKIPRKWGSKNTIQSILKDAVNQSYFEKKISKIDRRVKFFKLTPESKNDMELWLKNRNKIYQN